MCACVCVHKHDGTCAEVRGQFLGAGSFLPRGSQGSNSSCPAEQQVPSPPCRLREHGLEEVAKQQRITPLWQTEPLALLKSALSFRVAGPSQVTTSPKRSPCFTGWLTVKHLSKNGEMWLLLKTAPKKEGGVAVCLWLP